MIDAGREYYLVIKRQNNDFRSVEWNLTKFYQGENLYTLEGIDTFTRKITRKELVEDLLRLNIISPDDQFQSFAIIFKSGKKNRELREGVIFREDNAVIDEDEFIEFVMLIIDDKQMLNKVFNMCNFKEENEALAQFKYILKNINFFKLKGENGVKAALQLFKKIPYPQKRTIILKVVDDILLKKVATLELKNQTQN